MARTPQELADAIAVSVPGDTVVMANGTWTDLDLRFYADGIEGDTITLKAETSGRVILDGQSHLRIGGDYLKVEGLRFSGGGLTQGHVIEFRRSSSNLANHSRLTDCEITDYNPPNVSTQYKWVSVYGTHNRVDHCYFAGKTHDGATLVVWLRDPPNDTPSYHRIDHNYFGRRPELGKNGGETIRVGTSSRSMQDSYVTVENNLFEECDGEIEIISNKSGQNTYRYNTFRRSAGTLTLRHGNNAHVYGNFFLGESKSGTGGVRIIGERHRVYNNYFQDLAGTGYRAALAVVNGIPNSPLNRYFQVKEAIIAFNTFVNVEETFVIGAGMSSEQSLAPDSITIAGNLVWTGEGPIVENEDTPTRITYLANIFYGADTGIPQIAGVTVTDPEFERDASLWRPSATSPVRNAGTALDFVSEDMDGQPRDTTPDIGADERSDAAILRGPLTTRDVGPSFLGISLPIEPVVERVSSAIALGHAPNPFREQTTIRFNVVDPGNARLVIHDALGRQVAVLVHSAIRAGEHAVQFDAARLAPGVYVAILDMHGRRQSRLLIRH